jgi:hypothetical protein
MTVLQSYFVKPLAPPSRYHMAKETFAMKRVQAVVLLILGACVAGVYLAALCGPLKMAGDSPGYVELAAYLLHGTPPRTIAAPGYPYYFPHGYPWILIGLNAIGMANGPGIIGLNMLFGGVGLYFSWKLLAGQFGLSVLAALAVVSMTAAASCFFQSTCCPVSEMAYFAFSTGAVCCLERSRDKTGEWPFLLLGCSLVAASIFIRTVGVALVPAAIFAVFTQPLFKRWLTPARLANLAIVVGVVVCFAVSYLSDAHYVSATVPDRLAQLRGNGIGRVVFAKVSHVGEILTNQRAADYPLNYRAEFVLVGLIAIGLCAVALWSRCRRLGALDVYLIAYAGVVALYPFWQLRLWVPVLPFLLAYLLFGWCTLWGDTANAAQSRAGIAYCAAFVLVGCLCAINFTRSTVYQDVDDGIRTARAAAPHLQALRGSQ